MNQGVNSLINPENQRGGYGLSTPAQRGDNLRVEQLFAQTQNTCTFTMYISKRGMHSKAQLVVPLCACSIHGKHASHIGLQP